MNMSKDRGFRLAVRDGSLLIPTAPITGAENAVELKHENESNIFLATNKLRACGDPSS